MKTVSPIKAKPLRQAGQSLRDTLDDLVFDKLQTLMLITTLLWLLAFVEWVRKLQGADPAAELYTFIAAGFSVYAFARGYDYFKQARNIKLGLDGEQAVGEYLNRLVAKGYRVYHDIPCTKGNIDHVIICSRGVFTIETKTRSKPEKGDAVATFDGESITFNGYRNDDAPIRQARAQSAYLKTLLKEETGHDYPVKPVVVIPGWFVESLPGSHQSSVWVLNPKAVHKWIDNEAESITDEYVKLAATKLGKFVRNC